MKWKKLEEVVHQTQGHETKQEMHHIYKILYSIIQHMGDVCMYVYIVSTREKKKRGYITSRTTTVHKTSHTYINTYIR